MFTGGNIQRLKIFSNIHMSKTTSIQLIQMSYIAGRLSVKYIKHRNIYIEPITTTTTTTTTSTTTTTQNTIELKLLHKFHYKILLVILGHLSILIIIKNSIYLHIIMITFSNLKDYWVPMPRSVKFKKIILY